MATILHNIRLARLFDKELWAVKSVWPRYEYNGKERTDKVTGWVYTVINMTTLDIVKVYVEGAGPVVTAAQVAEANGQGERIYLELVNATISPYVDGRTGEIEDSIKAEAVKVVEEETI